MAPLIRATVATAVTASLALLGLPKGNAHTGKDRLQQQHLQQQQQQQQRHPQGKVRGAQRRRRTADDFGIGDGGDGRATEKTKRNWEGDYVPPWRDPSDFGPVIDITGPSSGATEPPTGTPTGVPTGMPTGTPTGAPTGTPTVPPTVPPTGAPTIRATTASPTASPVETAAAPTPGPFAAVFTPAPVARAVEDPSKEGSDSDSSGSTATTTNDGTSDNEGNADSVATILNEETGATESSCVEVPTIGTYVSEVLDIDYRLYFAAEESTEGTAGMTEAVRDALGSSIEPMLHESLVDLGMGCRGSDFITYKHTMVSLTSNATDFFVAGECRTERGDGDGGTSNATATTTPTVCYEGSGRVEATMWFSPRRRLTAPGSSTPFGDREAFLGFTNWMEEAFAEMGTGEGGAPLASANLTGASFAGYTNVDGLNWDLFATHQQTGMGVDLTSAFMGTAYAVDEGKKFNTLAGLALVVAGALALLLAVFFVAARRRKNRKAFLEHARCVDGLALDAEDDPSLDRARCVVDDASLFGQESLPAGYRVRTEGPGHDYGTCANPSCKLCGSARDRPGPVFVKTDPNHSFTEHRSTLQSRRDKEEAERRYESVML